MNCKNSTNTANDISRKFGGLPIELQSLSNDINTTGVLTISAIKNIRQAKAIIEHMLPNLDNEFDILGILGQQFDATDDLVRLMPLVAEVQQEVANMKMHMPERVRDDVWEVMQFTTDDFVSYNMQDMRNEMAAKNLLVACDQLIDKLHAIQMNIRNYIDTEIQPAINEARRMAKQDNN